MDGGFVLLRPVDQDIEIIAAFVNEMVKSDIVLLSKDDTKFDSQGNIITFYEGMPVSIYSNDVSDNGEVDNLIAEGIAIKQDLSHYPRWQHVKWCCRIDLKSMKHESDLKKKA